jgi:FkbM family methyltransferase
MVIDVGAHKGNFLWRARRCNPGAIILGFEPNREMFQYLLLAYKAFRGSSDFVMIYNLALMEKCGTDTLKIPLDENEPGLATLGEPKRFQGFREMQVNVTTLDSFYDDRPLLQLPFFIKIDVEGAEAMVIEGGQKTIARSRPHILFECASMNTSQFGLYQDAAENMLRNLGYRDFIQFGPWDMVAIGRDWDRRRFE